MADLPISCTLSPDVLKARREGFLTFQAPAGVAKYRGIRVLSVVEAGGNPPASG